MGLKDIRYYKEVELISWLAFLLSLTWIGQCLVICSLHNLFWLCSYLSINGYYILVYSNTELAFWLWSHLSIKGHCSYPHLQPHRVDLLQCEVSLVQEENSKQEVLREPHQSLTGSDFSVLHVSQQELSRRDMQQATSIQCLLNIFLVLILKVWIVCSSLSGSERQNWH